MKTGDDYVITLLQFRCVYEDKYIVSYEHGLKPIERSVVDHFRLENLKALEHFNFTRKWVHSKLIWRCMMAQSMDRLRSFKRVVESI